MGNDTETLTLTGFLLARIGEDEALAKACTNPSWAWADTSGRKTIADMEHVDRHSPERVLAECETKRRIVEIHTGNHECASLADSCEWIADGAVCETLRYLTLPYADHPDCRDDWRP